MTFTFTENWTNLNSSLVKGVYHDADKRQMLVRLSGDKQYVYTNVDRDEAERIADASSKGRAYNDFRRYRSSWQKGSTAHGEIVAPKDEVRRVQEGQAYVPPAAQVQTTTNNFTFVTSSSGLTSLFEVDFDLNGSKFTSTVKASSLVAAAQDVESKVSALGLNAKLTGVRLKV